jgi:hypothetical protein
MEVYMACIFHVKRNGFLAVVKALVTEVRHVLLHNAVLYDNNIIALRHLQYIARQRQVPF